ncbi:MAG: CopG family transcriptional regulator [Candidatus Aminicenantes bacterium]|nr:CopG family transcriptional regulator [Candidatus Aminicenantes bacterium]
MKTGGADIGPGTDSGRRNITLSLPRELIRESKALAARVDMSLSGLVRAVLEERIRDESGYNAAGERQAGILERGFDLGTRGRISFSRGELHERAKK